MKLLLSLLLAAPAFAAEKKGPSQGVNYRISFSMKLGDIERVGNFLVQDEHQANYVSGGERAVEEGPSAAMRKESTIVNCVPVAVAEKADHVYVECQFELVGPARAEKNKPRGVASFQYQTALVLKKGRSHVLIDEPEKRVELMIEDARDPQPVEAE